MIMAITRPKKKQATLPRMIRGSVVEHRRRCGKANCRCAEGVLLHSSTVLSYSEAGRTRFLMLPADQVTRVRAATARYQAAKQTLESQGNAGLAALVASLKTKAR
jgi:hypothetical protein